MLSDSNMGVHTVYNKAPKELQPEHVNPFQINEGAL